MPGVPPRASVRGYAGLIVPGIFLPEIRQWGTAIRTQGATVGVTIGYHKGLILFYVLVLFRL